MVPADLSLTQSQDLLSQTNPIEDGKFSVSPYPLSESAIRQTGTSGWICSAPGFLFSIEREVRTVLRMVA
jgi:hypothetical protein